MGAEIPAKHSSWSKKHTGKKGGSLNRTDIVEFTRSHGGGTDLPRKTVREALDFMTQEITRTVLDGKVVKLTGLRDRDLEDGRREGRRFLPEASQGLVRISKAFAGASFTGNRGRRAFSQL